jgi:hypothetical protein
VGGASGSGNGWSFGARGVRALAAFHGYDHGNYDSDDERHDEGENQHQQKKKAQYHEIIEGPTILTGVTLDGTPTIKFTGLSGRNL